MTRVYINGKFYDKADAKVSVYDHGLLYGDGVFEGIRVYQGRIFKCQQHMDRLYRCAEQIALKIPITPEEMVTVQRQCIEANNITEGYIRLVVTRGYGTLGLDPRKCPRPELFVIARPGDEIRLTFDAHSSPSLRAGWTRTFLLYSDGFSKEMDINSASPDRVYPLPFHGMSKYPYGRTESYPLTAERQAYIEKYNTRLVASPVTSIDCELMLRSLR